MSTFADDAELVPSPFRRGRLLRGWLVLVSGDVLSKLLSLVTVVFISRRLSVPNFGTYSFAVAYGGFFIFFTDLGLDAVTTRELAAHPVEEEGRILGGALAAKAVLVAIAVYISLVALVFFGHNLRLAGAVSVIALLAAIPGTPALLLNARVRVVGATIIQLVGSVVTLVATVAVIEVRSSPTGPVAVTVVVTVLVSVALLVLARRGALVNMTWDEPAMRRVLTGAAPLALSLIGVVIYRRVDQLLMGAMGRIQELARYAAAVRLVDALNIVPLAIATIALPALTHFHARGSSQDNADRLAAVSYRYLAAMILPIAALATYAGGPLMGIAFGSAYRVAGSSLAVLLWAHYFGFTGVMVDQLLIARRQSAYLAALTLTGAVINVGINLWAIPRYGAIGAAWASLAAYALPFVVGSFVRPVQDAFRSCFVHSARPAVAAGLVLLALWALRVRGVLVLPEFAVVTGILLLLTRSVTVAELKEMAQSALHRDGNR